MLLSIIIPVYNVEGYINKCLSSIFNQNIKLSEYEVIIINDGTKDNSMSIVEKYSELYSNIIIINQSNQGLSMARNNGLKHAKGEYIWFIDSDDTISENCLKEICNIFKHNIDLLQIQYRYTYDNESLNRDEKICEINKIISGKEQMLKGGLFIPAQFTIYRRTFLIQNNLFFYKNIYHEDSEFKPRALYLAKSCLSYNKVVYNYYQRAEGSITSQFKLKNGLDIITVNNSLISFIEKYNILPPYRNEFYNYIGMNLNTLFQGFKQLKNEDKKTLLIQLKKNKHLFYKMLHANKLKYKIESLLFIINIKLGILLFKICK